MRDGTMHDRTVVFSRAVWKFWGSRQMVIPDLATSAEKFVEAVERGNAVCRKYFPHYTLYCVGIKLRPEHRPHYEMSCIPPDAEGWAYGCEFEPMMDGAVYSRDHLQSFKNEIYDIGVDMGASYYRFGGMMKGYIRRVFGDAVVDRHLALKRAADPAMILNRDVIFLICSGLHNKLRDNADYAACSGCSLCLLVCPVWRRRRDDLRLTPHGRAKALQHGAVGRRHRRLDRELHAVRRVRTGLPGEHRPGRHGARSARQAAAAGRRAKFADRMQRQAARRRRNPRGRHACCCRASLAQRARHPGAQSRALLGATQNRARRRRRRRHRAGAGSRRDDSGAAAPANAFSRRCAAAATSSSPTACCCATCGAGCRASKITSLGEALSSARAAAPPPARGRPVRDRAARLSRRPRSGWSSTTTACAPRPAAP